VTAIVEHCERFVRLEVDAAPCVAYPGLTGPVAIGDDVLVNVQARNLLLGSGGFDVLYANLTRGLGLAPDEGAHVMKLPYTPLQRAVKHAEEDEPQAPALAGMPVVCCSLHSQVAPVCAGVGRDARVVFLQLAGGALPVSLSDTIRTLHARGLVETSVAVGSCIEADAVCVSVASGLAWAAGAGFDAAVCAIGPGIVGTGSPLGHGGVAAAEAANAASALEGRAVVAIRASAADARDRHRGVSHHSRAVLRLCLGDVVAAWPRGEPAPEWLEGREEVNVEGWEEECAGLPLEHMRRTPGDDPLFFAAAFAAGRAARNLLH